MNLPDFGQIAAASRQVATSSAMNPILWTSVICTPFAIVCSVLARPPLSYLLFGLAALPIMVGSWGFWHFARKDPKRLQSEGHLEVMKRLSMRLGSNDPSGRTVVEIAQDSELIQNPTLDSEAEK